MAYVPVPKDLSKVKTKVALNLTKRQLIFFSLAAVTGIPLYLVTRKTLGNSASAILMVTAMLPFFFLAMFEKDGLPFEKIVRNILRQKVFSRPVRFYRTENVYAGRGILTEKEGGYNGKAKRQGRPAIRPNGAKSPSGHRYRRRKTKQRG